MIKRPIRTAVIDDHIAPYRLMIFNYIAEMPEIDLKVFYGTRRFGEREWEIPAQMLKYKFQVSKSLVLRFRKKTH